MRRIILSAAVLLATIAAGTAQVVRAVPNRPATDAWGRYFTSGKKVTFVGRVTGVQVTRPTGSGDDEVTLLVKNTEGGGTAIVDLGPEWFVDHQVAKVRTRDNVRITGSKVIVDGHGVILASLITVNGDGGPVLALRRPGGKPYWLGMEVAANPTIPNGNNVINGTVTGITSYTLDNVPYSAAILQTNDGYTTIDLGPQWYYGRQNFAYRAGDYVSVVVGPNPIQVNPYTTIMPSYSVYGGSNVYTLRNGNGIPVYNWNGR